MQPGFIEEHLLACCSPEPTDLLGLASRSKGVLLDAQGDDVFEMVGFGIGLANFPCSDCMPGNPENLRKSGLRQSERHSKLQHALTEGIIELSKRRFLHASSSFYMILYLGAISFERT
jgi:hypothetical protein